MRQRSTEMPPIEVDWTPMIDMTFQLIAFFMVLLNFSQSEQNDKVILPSSELAKPVETPLEFPVIIHVTESGSLVIGGEEFGLESLRGHLAPELSLLKLEGKTASDANIVIRGHQYVPSGRVQDVIGRCQELGFEKFALRVKEEI